MKGADRLADDGAHPPPWIEAGRRILKNDLQAAPQCAGIAPLSRAGDIDTVEFNPSPGRWQQTDQQAGNR